MGVNLLGTPAPKSLIIPEVPSFATYWSVRLARKIRTDSDMPSVTPSWISEARSDSPA